VVLFWCPNFVQLNNAGLISAHHDNSPAARQRSFRARQMLGSDDQRHGIEAESVKAFLASESVEGIAIALNLEAAEAAVDDGEVRPRGALHQPKLLDDQC
jgi:hypothetical protein